MMFFYTSLKETKENQECPKKSKNELKYLPEIVSDQGYCLEEHKITTSDGVDLTLHRIPMTRNECQSSKTNLNQNKPRVLLLHGIFGSSAHWCLGPPDKVNKSNQ